MIKAEIIAVGSELLTPDNIDTNSLYLTQRLNEAGCQVHLKTVVGDDHDDIAAVLRLALLRSDIIIFSGGLGPTEDDLTRAAVASVLERPLHIDERNPGHIAPEIRRARVSHGQNQREAGRGDSGRRDHRQSARHRAPECGLQKKAGMSFFCLVRRGNSIQCLKHCCRKSGI